MITKESILDTALNWFVVLAAPGTVFSMIANLNPGHAIFGAVGQVLFLCMIYMQNVYSGGKNKDYPILFFIVSICVGGALAFVLTPTISQKSGFNELFISSIIGFCTQWTVKIAMRFLKNNNLLKDEDVNEKDS